MTNTNQTLGDALKSPDPADRVRWWRAAGGSSHPTAGRLGSALADDVERLTDENAKLRAALIQAEKTFSGYDQHKVDLDAISAIRAALAQS